MHNVGKPSSVSSMDDVFSNFSKQCIQGSLCTFYYTLHRRIKHKDNVYHVTSVTFPSLTHCQNKPLHYTAEDLNHLSSDASSCYLDNCQQEQAFPSSQRHAAAPSCSLLTILHTWSQQESVRMPIIFTVCCAGYSGEAECYWLPWQKLTAPWAWDPCKSTHQSAFFSGQEAVPVAMSQVMEHHTAYVLVLEHKQRRSFSASLNMHWVTEDHKSCKKRMSLNLEENKKQHVLMCLYFLIYQISVLAFTFCYWE